MLARNYSNWNTHTTVARGKMVWSFKKITRIFLKVNILLKYGPGIQPLSTHLPNERESLYKIL